MSRFSIDTDVLDEGINKLSGIQEKLDSLQQRFLMISREIDWEVKGKHALEGNLAQLQAQMKSISISVAIASQSMAQIRDEYINAYNDAKSLADGLPTKVSAGSYSRAEGMLQDPDIPEFVKARIRESIGATKGIKGTGKDNTGSNEGFDYKWTGKAVNDEFKEKVLEISDKLQMDPDDLMAVMAFESGFDPALVHKKTKATGLIQLMPTNAEWLGTSIEELVTMSAIDQLDYVYKYFKRYTGKLNSVGDAYLVTFCPALVGKNDDDAVYIKGSTVVINKDSGKTAGEAYNDNMKMDLNDNGYIEKWEIVERITKVFDKYDKIN